MWRSVRSDAPLPAAGGTVLAWLSDDFNTSPVDTARWEVTGSPTISLSELNIPSGAVLLSRQSFRPPCLIEVVATMTARAASDDFRLGFYTDDNNLVEWRAAGTTASNMDSLMVAGGTGNNQLGINVGAANLSYRLASIYVGIAEVVYAYRAVNTTNVRNEVYRIVEHGIPDGPFRVRLAGVAGTSTLRVHRVSAYQLADIIPPGALGHHLDQMSIPVRVTNGPWVASPSHQALGAVQSTTDTFSSLAAGSIGTGSSRAFYPEQAHVQCYIYGDQPFTAWVEMQGDGTNWQVIWYGSSTDATVDATAGTRYFAVSPLFYAMGSRNFRVRVRNTGASAGTFRGVFVATSL